MPGSASTKRKGSVTLLDYFGASAKKTRRNPVIEGSRRVIKQIHHEECIISDEDDDATVVGDIARYEDGSVISRTPQERPSLSAGTKIPSTSEDPPHVPDQAIRGEDEWAMGDDEGMIPEGDDLNEDNVEVCQGYYDNSSTCPVCDRSLKGMFITVNIALLFHIFFYEKI